MTYPSGRQLAEGDNPFDIAYEHQLEVIRHVRRRMHDLAALRERIEHQVQVRYTRSAASEKDSEVTTEIADLTFQADLLRALEQSLETTSRRVQHHVERFRTEKELLKATCGAADALILAVEAMSLDSPPTAQPES